jgi:perosamine synthetase
MDPLISAIENALPPERPINHHSPCFSDEKYAVGASLGALATDYYQKALADRLMSYCGVKAVIPVASGTAALQLALTAAGVLPGEEVFVPALTFAATAAAVVHAGAVPHFVDGGTTINAYKLRRHIEATTSPTPTKRGRFNNKTGRVISAICGVDILGFPADWGGISDVARESGLILIEDAAEALGSKLDAQSCGSFGSVAILSFNSNKIVTGGGGGAILTNDEWIAAKAWDLATTCRLPHPWLIEHNGIGFNYRMPALNAALILSQMEKIDVFLKAKKELFERYKSGLGNRMLEPKEWQGEPNYWLSTMLADNEKHRDELLGELHKREIRARALFTPLHKLEPYKLFPRQTNLMQAEDLFAKAICLPSGQGALQWTL